MCHHLRERLSPTAVSVSHQLRLHGPRPPARPLPGSVLLKGVALNKLSDSAVTCGHLLRARQVPDTVHMC